jgi:small-conductance mechanosensitive channel
MIHLARVLLFSALLPLAGTAAGQIPGLSAAKAEPAADQQATPETIPVASIPQRAEAAERLIQQVMQRSTSPASALAMAADLQALNRSVEALEEQTGTATLEKMPISGLLALERHLKFLDHELNLWHRRLQLAIRPLAADAAELAQLRKLWQDTRQLSEALTVPALQQSIDNLLVQFAQAELKVSGPLSQLLQLSHEANNGVNSRVSGNLAAVRGRIATIDRGLWCLDSDNLIHALWTADGQRNGDIETLLNVHRVDLAFMKEFDRATSGTIRVAMAIILLLLPGFLLLSHRAKQVLATDAQLQPYRRILTRPFSAWLLLAVAVLVLVQFYGPLLRLKALLLLAWLPVMRLQSRDLRENVGRWIYLTAVCFLINLGGQLVATMPVIFRLVLLANGLLMLTAFGWLLWRTLRAMKAGSTRMLRVLRLLSAVGAAFMAIALGANLIGNVSLATMLTDATLSSAYMGLFLFAFGNLIRSFARLLFRAAAEKLRSRTQYAGGLMDVSARLFNLALILSWGYGTLEVFRCLWPLQVWLLAVSSHAFALGNLSFTIGGIVLFGVSVFLSFWLAKTLRGVLAEDILPNMALPRGVANSVSTMSYYLLLMLGLMVALAAAGFHLSQLALVIGALSVGIGFGLQTVVNNFVSGLILMLERPIQPGDTIELAGTLGKVREIGMRATTLTTFEGADVVVPNGMLLSEKMINWTLSSDKRRIDIPVGVAYGNDPEQVLALLEKVAIATPRVIRKPAPTVLFTGFGDSSLNFSVRAWTNSFDDGVFVRSALAVNIHAALKAADIEIPFPQRDLHLRTVPPELRKHLQSEPSLPD